jgi:hypothetical protein
MVGDNTPFMDANQDSFKLAQRLYSSFYNLYSQIPFSLNWSPDNQFYGLSPGISLDFFINIENLTLKYSGH